MKILTKIIPFIISIILLIICNNFIISCTQSKIITSTITKISYRYNDASVPPDDHRSYSITLTATQAHIVVDSYGDILADSTYKISQSQFDSLVDYLAVCKIEPCAETDYEGCTGGTSDRLDYGGGDINFSGIQSHCGGKDYGSMSGDIRSFRKKIRKLIPNIEELLQ